MITLAWFEIPVTDLGRAVNFYGTVLNCDIPIVDKRDNYGSMVGILVNQGGIIGTLTQNSRNPYIPSQSAGCIVYLNIGEERLDTVLDRVENENGHIVLPITPIDPTDPTGEKGSVAWIIDCEGNRIGLHQHQEKN